MRKYTIKNLLPLLGLITSVMAFGQSGSENYVQSKTCLNEDCSRVSETVTYFDGLGRPKQVVSVKSTPAGKDLVTAVTYDGFGRKVRDILPVPAQTQNSGIHPGITDENAANSHYGVSNAFSEKQLENSPLDRVLQQAHPGEAWKMSSGKTQQFSYDANSGNEVKKFLTITSPDTSNNVSTGISVLSVSAENSGFYPASTLYKNTVTDEDGNPVTEFTNGRGQTLLIRRNDGSGNVDTYYVYNEYNQLAYVLSPKAVQQITQNNNVITEAVLNELCYQYRYDGRDRLVEKRLPGKDWEWMVYDKQDRLVLSQDANLRTVTNNFNAKGWLFTKYDELGRVAYTGFFSNTANRQVMQNALNSMAANPYNNEKRSASPFNLAGMNVYYDKKGFPTGSMTILSINYYDTYPQGAEAVSSVLDQPVLAPSLSAGEHASTNGLLTASLVRNIEDDQWTKTYTYYDTTGRVIATRSVNHLGGYTNTDLKLSFSGTVRESRTYHRRTRISPEVVVKERFVYDSQDRLTGHYHQVDGNPEVLLAENTYDELSQLSNKKVGNNLQSIDYAYNIRGWMTHINRDQMSVPDLGGKLFAYRIRYNEKEGITNPDGALFSGKDVLARYNGNIAEVDWRSVENIGNSPSLTPKRYGYAYDHLNRLRAGYYQNPQNPGSKENTESIDYDLNGNITNLYRSSVIESGNTATVIDRLEYFYASGNKSNTLDHITDHQNNPTGYEGGSGVIHHDANGNMDKMQDKNMESIAYNYLNLPNRIVYGGGFKIESKYNASGIKLQKRVPRTECGIMNCTFFMDTTDYLDGFQYLTTTSTTSGGGGGGSESESMRMAAESAKAFEIQAFSSQNPSTEPLNTMSAKDPDLQFFPTAEGFYDYKKDQYIYQYRDHLGNTRISFARNSAGALEIVDVNDYYPFGMSHLKSGTAMFGQGSYKNYKYNGKELQETGMYDYGARMYMADIGRWGVVDPLTNEMRRYSPYNYVFNNPINFVDPDGRAPAGGPGDGTDGKTIRTQDIEEIVLIGKRKTQSFFNWAWNGIKSAFTGQYSAKTNTDKYGGLNSYRQWQASPFYNEGETKIDRIFRLIGNSKREEMLDFGGGGYNMWGGYGRATKAVNAIEEASNLISAKSTAPQVGESLGVTIKDGNMSVGGNVNGRFDFVVTQSGELKVGRGHYFLSGEASNVQAAGQIRLHNGQIIEINNASGHYAPSAAEAKNFPSILSTTGTNTNKAKLITFEE